VLWWLLLDKHAVALYSCLYSKFGAITGAATDKLIKINNSTSLTFGFVYAESPIYINDLVKDIEFSRIHAEAAGASVVQVDGSTGGAIQKIILKGGKISCLSNGGSTALVNFTKARGVHMQDFHILDEFSVANRPYITIDELYGYSIKNLTLNNGSGNSHIAISSPSVRADYGTIDNIYVETGTITTALTVGNTTISNTNLPVSFNGASQTVVCINVSGTVNSTNCNNGLITIGCSTVTDTGGLAATLGYSGNLNSLLQQLRPQMQTPWMTTRRLHIPLQPLAVLQRLLELLYLIR